MGVTVLVLGALYAIGYAHGRGILKYVISPPGQPVVFEM